MIIAITAITVSSQNLSVKHNYKNGDFKLVHQSVPANILTSATDFKVVQIAANDLAADVERVTGKKPFTLEPGQSSANAVIIGTLGKNPLIDDLVKGRQDRCVADSRKMGKLSHHNRQKPAAKY